ncbi:hypothetical protein A2U01_0035537, partial [Trifolium medium]|nr:hypothetical protein [Trifolium medium]
MRKASARAKRERRAREREEQGKLEESSRL